MNSAAERWPPATRPHRSEAYWEERTDLVLNTAIALEEPLLEALSNEYGPKRGWAVCGPASIVLARLLSAITGVPFCRGHPDERRQLYVGIVVGKDGSQAIDHTQLHYYGGDEHKTVFVIDSITKLLWGDGRPSTYQDWQDMVSAMHDHRAFQNSFFTDSGVLRDVSPYWGDRLSRVAQAVLQRSDIR
jgi:hypothetical protein